MNGRKAILTVRRIRTNSEIRVEKMLLSQKYFPFRRTFHLEIKKTFSIPTNAFS